MLEIGAEFTYQTKRCFWVKHQVEWLFDNASRGSTPLIIAAQNGHCEVVQHLLAAGADKAGTAGGEGYIAREGRQTEYRENELLLQNCKLRVWRFSFAKDFLFLHLSSFPSIILCFPFCTMFLFHVCGLCNSRRLETESSFGGREISLIFHGAFDFAVRDGHKDLASV